jgi:hypothetical protein
MPTTRVYTRSFGSGELSPEMYGRIDSGNYQAGAALVENFITTPQGALKNRPGFKYVSETKYSTRKCRLIPFASSSEETLVLEIGHQYTRFHKNGSPLLVPFAYQAIWVNTSTYEAGRIVRDGGNRFWARKSSLNKPPATNPDYWYSLDTIDINGSTYAILEIPSPWIEEDIFDVHYVQSNDVITFVHPDYTTYELLHYDDYKWNFNTVLFDQKISAPTSVSVTFYRPPSDTVTNVDTYQYVSYCVTAIAADEVSESEQSSTAQVNCNIYIGGAKNTISWSAVTGATYYNVYKQQAGIFGFLGRTDSLSLVDDNIAPDLSITPPTYDSTFNSTGITSVPITNGGTGYGLTAVGGEITSIRQFATYTRNALDSTYHPVTAYLTDPTGSGCTLYVNWSATLFFGNYKVSISSINVTTRGANYTNPTLHIVWGTHGDFVPSDTFGVIYTPPTLGEVTLQVTDSGGGSGAVLTPYVSSTGVITGIRVDKSGSGYVNPVVSVVNAYGGTGAAFGTPVLGGQVGFHSVSYFEQRRIFAATKANPQTLWFTKSGTEGDMSYSLPTRDDDRIKFQIAAREASTVQHIVPLNQLVLLTSSAEWKISSVSSDYLTPSTISVRPQSYVGSNAVQPAVINNTMVYCASRGGHARELGYSWQANGFITGDLSLRAIHLFDGYQLNDMCYQKSPLPIIWFISSTGKLLGFTYVPEEQIGAWHQHTTDGSFESCAAISEGNEDGLYVIVNRTIGGVTKRFVERLESRAYTDIEDQFFVDSGKSFDGTNYTATLMRAYATTPIVPPAEYLPSTPLTLISSASGTFASTDVGDAIILTSANGTKYRLTIQSYVNGTTVNVLSDLALAEDLRNALTANWAWARDTMSGLSHLNGKTVSILADGAVLSQQVVSNGTVTLVRPYAKVHIGLPYQSNLETLPLVIQNTDGFGQGRSKNINKAWLRIYRSSAMFVGPSEDNLVEAKLRTTEAYGSPTELKSEVVQLVLNPSWQETGKIYVRQVDPLPLTILAITEEVTIGG